MNRQIATPSDRQVDGQAGRQIDLIYVSFLFLLYHDNYIEFSKHSEVITKMN